MKAVDTAALEASQGKPTTRRAPRFPVAILAALEVAVSDRALPTYLRGVAWLRLVKIWGTLRFDDTSWLAPSGLHVRDGALTATLTRTKTSGAGRRVPELPLAISNECFAGLVGGRLRALEEAGTVQAGLLLAAWRCHLGVGIAAASQLRGRSCRWACAPGSVAHPGGRPRERPGPSEGVPGLLDGAFGAGNAPVRTSCPWGAKDSKGPPWKVVTRRSGHLHPHFPGGGYQAPGPSRRRHPERARL